MGEQHDNHTPCRRGAYTLGPVGIVYYFPIEEPGPLKPALALILVRYPDGSIGSYIDAQWTALHGLD